MSFSLFASIAFILAGGIGNLIDRVSHGGLVTDFINLGIGSIRTGIFIVADLAVTCGVIALGYFSIRRNTGKRNDASKSRGDKKSRRGGSRHFRSIHIHI